MGLFTQIILALYLVMSKNNHSFCTSILDKVLSLTPALTLDSIGIIIVSIINPVSNPFSTWHTANTPSVTVLSVVATLALTYKPCHERKHSLHSDCVRLPYSGVQKQPVILIPLDLIMHY